MEVLSCILKRALRGGFLKGFLASGRREEGIVVSHLLFANDTLVFCDAGSIWRFCVGLSCGLRQFPG